MPHLKTKCLNCRNRRRSQCRNPRSETRLRTSSGMASAAGGRRRLLGVVALKSTAGHSRLPVCLSFPRWEMRRNCGHAAEHGHRIGVARMSSSFGGVYFRKYSGILQGAGRLQSELWGQASLSVPFAAMCAAPETYTFCFLHQVQLFVGCRICCLVRKHVRLSAVVVVVACSGASSLQPGIRKRSGGGMTECTHKILLHAELRSH